jgi:hypothetical protein
MRNFEVSSENFQNSPQGMTRESHLHALFTRCNMPPVPDGRLRLSENVPATYKVKLAVLTSVTCKDILNVNGVRSAWHHPERHAWTLKVVIGIEPTAAQNESFSCQGPSRPPARRTWQLSGTGSRLSHPKTRQPRPHKLHARPIAVANR